MPVIRFFSPSSGGWGGAEKDGVPFFKLTQGEYLNCERNHKSVIIKSQPDLACDHTSCPLTPEPPAPQTVTHQHVPVKCLYRHV